MWSEWGKQAIATLTVYPSRSGKYSVAVADDAKSSEQWWLHCEHYPFGLPRRGKETLPPEKPRHWQRELSADERRQIGELIATSTIPAVPPIGGGLDGVRYELRFDRGFNGANYGWWQDPPPGWEDLGRL